MLVDARSLPADERLEADVCIVGAGAAGIALALELARDSVRVALMESGGLRPHRRSQRLYKGELAGAAHRPLDAVRSRRFGGTTWRWAGGCVRLDPIDLEARDWIPHSGWPIGYGELSAYYRRAAALCGIEPEAEPPPALREAAGEPGRNGLAARVAQYSPYPRFGEHYRSALECAPEVTVGLYANLVRIETGGGGEVAGLRFATLGGGAFDVRARLYVLAAGAIENARLLLLARGDRSDGLGDENGLLGRFYMTHPRIVLGTLEAEPEPVSSLFEHHAPSGVRIQTELCLSEATLRRERLQNVAATFIPSVRQATGRGAASALFVAKALRRGYLPSRLGRHLQRTLADLPSAALYALRRLGGDYPPRRPAELFRLHLRVEQAPNPESRVTLSERRDALGLRRARLDWRPLESDWESAARCAELLRSKLEDAGLGRLRHPLRGGDEDWRAFVVDTAHHMGTTRMHPDPRQGVVDENCRLHSTGNLFVAGSAVFPTAGIARPTLTLLALAIRLADHLKTRLA